ncbi:hypothetical protein BHE74_00040928 [Ensete ventricosum]|nr:hypothetical protein BHE74_00040928 [Ensete ventricosum]
MGCENSFESSPEMERFLCERLLDPSQPISERFRALFSLRNLRGAGPREALICGTFHSSSKDSLTNDPAPEVQETCELALRRIKEQKSLSSVDGTSPINASPFLSVDPAVPTSLISSVDQLSGKTRTARYIPVRQLTDTRTGRYRAVPLRSTVGGRFRSSTVDFRRLRSIQGEIDRRRSIEEEKGKKKKRKRRRRRRGEVPRTALAATPPGGRPQAVAALAPSPPALPQRRRRPRCPSVVAARVALAPSPAGFFLPTRERVRGDLDWAWGEQILLSKR